MRVPAYYSDRQTLAGANSVEEEVTSFGDVTLGLSKTLWDQTADYPGAAVSTTVYFPTGSSPYVFGDDYVVGSNPTDLFRNYLSTGVWAVGGNLQFFKTVDPLILFAGGGLTYAFSKEIEGHEVQPLPAVSLNAGFSFALSEKTTLAASVNYLFSDGLRVDGADIERSEEELATGQLLLVQRVGTGLYLEPSVTIGLTDGSQDVSFGLAIRKRL